jgi:hypothetical protein
MEKILYEAFEAEILEEQDWFYASKNWEFNFTYEDDCESVIAYRRYGFNTDWSDYIILSQRVREWKTIV